MLAVERSPALNELGTVTGDQPSVLPTLRHQPPARPASLGSARNSQAPPSSQRSSGPSRYNAPSVGAVAVYSGPGWASAGGDATAISARTISAATASAPVA